MTEFTGMRDPTSSELQLTEAEADTIRILVATDNHVGFEERDAIRKDDSWRTFDEVLNIARNQDVRLSSPACTSSR